MTFRNSTCVLYHAGRVVRVRPRPTIGWMHAIVHLQYDPRRVAMAEIRDLPDAFHSRFSLLAVNARGENPGICNETFG